MSSLHEQGNKRLKQAIKYDQAGQYALAVPEYVAALEYFLAELKYEKVFVKQRKQSKEKEGENNDAPSL